MRDAIGTVVFMSILFVCSHVIVIAPWASFCDYVNDALDGGSNR